MTEDPTLRVRSMSAEQCRQVLLMLCYHHPEAVAGAITDVAAAEHPAEAERF